MINSGFVGRLLTLVAALALAATSPITIFAQSNLVRGTSEMNAGQGKGNNRSKDKNPTQKQSQSQEQGQRQDAKAINGGQKNAQTTTFSSSDVRQAPMALGTFELPTDCKYVAGIGGSGTQGGLSLGLPLTNKVCQAIQEAFAVYAVTGDPHLIILVMCKQKQLQQLVPDCIDREEKFLAAKAAEEAEKRAAQTDAQQPATATRAEPEPHELIEENNYASEARPEKAEPAASAPATNRPMLKFTPAPTDKVKSAGASRKIPKGTIDCSHCEK